MPYHRHFVRSPFAGSVFRQWARADRPDRLVEGMIGRSEDSVRTVESAPLRGDPGRCAPPRAIRLAGLVRRAARLEREPRPQPGSELRLRQATFGEREHRDEFFLLRRFRLGAVQKEKSPVRDMRGALVAVHERMVASCKTVRQSGCQIREIGRRISMGVQLPRARERRTEQTLVADAGAAAVLCDLPSWIASTVSFSSHTIIAAPQLPASLRSTLRSLPNRHVLATEKRRKGALESDGLICARHQFDPGAAPKEPSLDSIEPVGVRQAEAGARAFASGGR